MIKTAYFAGGCFWCITPVFKETDGVTSVVSGYAGGDEVNPTYEDVKNQKTGHRETIRVEYDDTRITYDELFMIYLGGIDPYDAGGQFIDRGHSYTLAVYYTDEAQRETALSKIAWAEGRCGQKLAIAVEPYKNFYPAEEYHQDYYLKNPEEFEKELIESGRKNAPEKKKKLKAPKRARDIIIIALFCIVALLTIFSYLVELPAFSGIEEQLTSNVMNNLESSDEYQVAYNYFLESEIFARLDAKEEDISFHGSNKSTSFGLSGKDSTYTLSLSLYGGVYEIICHENESGWYVCTDCTQVK